MNWLYCALVVSAMSIVSSSGRAATCGAGYWIDGDTCVPCNIYDATYCPGDGLTHQCPVDTVDWDNYFKNGTVSLIGLHSWGCGSYDGNATSIGCCLRNLYVEDSRGRRYCECGYNTASYTDNVLCWFRNAYAGYYLSDWDGNRFNEYNNVRACSNAPEHAHYTGPGTPDEPKSGGKKDYNDCPWECDRGYERHGDVCTTLCTAGFTQLKTSSGVTVNVYADKPSTPALNISTSRGTCYVTLAAGAANNAINVNYNGATYHTTD